MREKFIDVNFRSAARQTISTASEIITEYLRDGYKLSLRQLYYQFVSRDLIPNTERSYKNLGAIISQARMAGLLDWEAIEDRGREFVENPHWDSPADVVRSCAAQFRYDLWETQPTYVEVMVEKEALEGVIQPICEEWDIGFTANKGYSSASAMYEAGQRIAEAIERGQRVVILYLGDHDPSGIDMSRDVAERLAMFSRAEVSDLEIQRLGLNLDQIQKYRPPPNPAKFTDSRAKDYVAKFGPKSWELDALNPKVLGGLIRDAVKKIVFVSAFNEAKRKQLAARKLLETVADKIEEDEEAVK